MSTSQVIVVTGVSSGIGQVTAVKFAELGHRVFGTVRNIEKTKPIANVELVKMDISDEDSVQHAIHSIINKAGHIDVLINNAGTSLIGAIEETSIKEAEFLFNTNVYSILRTIQAVVPYMRLKQSGRIINISSVLGFLPSPYMGVYSATKHAVEGLSESLDHELRQFGIRVTAVQPSFTKTNLDKNAPWVKSMIPEYDYERNLATNAISNQIDKAPQPDSVADTIVSAALSGWHMYRTPSGQASLLSKLRRFMPSGPVDKSIRKTFGLK
ncbi:oxidoreductase [Acinetobacter halotolerans]|uniref:Oxidoreductase n=1 Tax=Acinetobacter halotolerans TaxID=1752076 RepID=A0A4Q6XMF6_9GAMM|nr:oxidoreductase [Acinetobacter halotolerans]RZF55887.1 oxidoreductase [Acinetobacter halotolerans]